MGLFVIFAPLDPLSVQRIRGGAEEDSLQVHDREGTFTTIRSSDYFIYVFIKL